MPEGAPRRPSRPWHRRARGAFAAVCLCLVGQGALACEAVTSGKGLPGRTSEVEFSNRAPNGGQHENWVPRDTRLIFHAGFDVPTREYNHGVLGSLKETKHLAIHLRLPGDSRITCPRGVILPRGHVFEDTAPRLVDLTGDGLPEIITVVSDAREGARLAIFDRQGRSVAETPPIGRGNRWLAPAAIADFDGDGRIEIAYVDRPHLAKRLRIWRFDQGKLSHVADAEGLTNHRIGEEFISGGLRTCAGAPEIITANANWTRIMATRLEGQSLVSRDIGPFNGPQSLTAARNCS